MAEGLICTDWETETKSRRQGAYGSAADGRQSEGDSLSLGKSRTVSAGPMDLSQGTLN